MNESRPAWAWAAAKAREGPQRLAAGLQGETIQDLERIQRIDEGTSLDPGRSLSTP